MNSAHNTLIASSDKYGVTSQYIAKITGTDAKYGMSREFIGAKKGQTTTAVIDEDGLYELGTVTKKGDKKPLFRLVLGGKVFWLGRDNEDQKTEPAAVAMLIAKKLDRQDIADIAQATEDGNKFRIR